MSGFTDYLFFFSTTLDSLSLIVPAGLSLLCLFSFSKALQFSFLSFLLACSMGFLYHWTLSIYSKPNGWFDIQFILWTPECVQLDSKRRLNIRVNPSSVLHLLRSYLVSLLRLNGLGYFLVRVTSPKLSCSHQFRTTHVRHVDTINCFLDRPLSSLMGRRRIAKYLAFFKACCRIL